MSLSRNTNPSHQPTHASNSSNSSNSSNLVGSFLGSVVGYPIVHTITSAIVRYQASTLPVTSMSPKILYGIVFNNPYNGMSSILSHALSLLNGYTVGLAYKSLQTTVRYPAQKYFTSKINENSDAKHFFENLAGDQSSALTKASAGSCAGITEGIICQPIDTLRNLLITLNKKMTYKETMELAIQKNIKLYNGIQFTLPRNAIGGFVQFGTYALVMKYAFSTIDGAPAKSKLTIASEISLASWIAAAMMILTTMPLDNKKLRAQLETTGTYSGFFSLFKGAIPKIATKSIGPTIFMTLGEIFTRWINQVTQPEKSLEMESKQTVTEQTVVEKTAVEKTVTAQSIFKLPSASVKENNTNNLPQIEVDEKASRDTSNRM